MSVFADRCSFVGVRRHGAQNAHDAASKSTLENEFGTSNEDECMTKILEMGTLQETEVSYTPILMLCLLALPLLCSFFVQALC